MQKASKYIVRKNNHISVRFMNTIKEKYKDNIEKNSNNEIWSNNYLHTSCKKRTVESFLDKKLVYLMEMGYCRIELVLTDIAHCFGLNILTHHWPMQTNSHGLKILFINIFRLIKFAKKSLPFVINKLSTIKRAEVFAFQLTWVTIASCSFTTLLRSRVEVGPSSWYRINIACQDSMEFICTICITSAVMCPCWQCS